MNISDKSLKMEPSILRLNDHCMNVNVHIVAVTKSEAAAKKQGHSEYIPY